MIAFINIVQTSWSNSHVETTSCHFSTTPCVRENIHRYYRPYRNRPFSAFQKTFRGHRYNVRR